MLCETDILSVWDEILPGIETIHEESPWNDWRPEDVYASCLSGESVLFTQEGVPARDSFTVATIDTKPRNQERVLHIWLAWSPKHPGASEAFEGLEALALRTGCTAIELVTGSSKVREHAYQFGFEKMVYCVRKELGETTDSDA